MAASQEPKAGSNGEISPANTMPYIVDAVRVYATGRGEIFCLDPTTGRIRWHNPLKGMGWGLCTIAGTNIAPMAQYQANQQQAANGAAVGSTSAS